MATFGVFPSEGYVTIAVLVRFDDKCPFSVAGVVAVQHPDEPFWPEVKVVEERFLDVEGCLAVSAETVLWRDVYGMKGLMGDDLTVYVVQLGKLSKAFPHFIRLFETVSQVEQGEGVGQEPFFLNFNVVVLKAVVQFFSLTRTEAVPEQGGAIGIVRVEGQNVRLRQTHDAVVQDERFNCETPRYARCESTRGLVSRKK